MSTEQVRAPQRPTVSRTQPEGVVTETPASPAVLQADDLHVYYGEFLAVKNVDLDVPPH